VAGLDFVVGDVSQEFPHGFIRSDYHTT
jgi:hypothetical protein